MARGTFPLRFGTDQQPKSSTDLKPQPSTERKVPTQCREVQEVLPPWCCPWQGTSQQAEALTRTSKLSL